VVEAADEVSDVREPAVAALAAQAALAPGVIATGTSATPTGPVAVPDLDGPAAAPSPDEPAPGRSRLLRQVLPLVLAVAVLGGASWVSWTSARDGFETTVTALSAGRPGEVNAAGLRTVPVTASGLVAAQGPFRVVVTGENGMVIDQRTVPSSDAAWTATLIVPGRQKVTIALMRAADTQPYRTVLISPQF
jgi:hypothetical protein